MRFSVRAAPSACRSRVPDPALLWRGAALRNVSKSGESPAVAPHNRIPRPTPLPAQRCFHTQSAPETARRGHVSGVRHNDLSVL